MIRSVGLKKLSVLAILIFVNVVMAAGLYLYIYPAQLKKKQMLTVLNSQTVQKQNDIDRIQIAFEQLAGQQATFDMLRARGFFGNQGRREAEKALSVIQSQSGVISAIANIQPGQVKDDEEAQKAEHKILESKVSVTIEALSDIDIYRYLYLLQNSFPGHVTFENIGIVRKGEVTEAVLRSIATDKAPPLVEAKIIFAWRTMIPQAEITGGEGGAGG